VVFSRAASWVAGADFSFVFIPMPTHHPSPRVSLSAAVRLFSPPHPTTHRTLRNRLHTRFKTGGNEQVRMERTGQRASLVAASYPV